MFDDDFDDFSALDAGALYALGRHGQDRQTEAIVAAINAVRTPVQNDDDTDPMQVDVHVHQDVDFEDRRDIAPINFLDFASVDMPADWDEYIGQEPMKKQLGVYMNEAMVDNQPLPHTLLASGFPGVGKTTMARLIAVTLGVKMIELVPPFNVHALVEAAQQLDDRDILFIDEIHKLADSGKRGAELLLKVLEEKVAIVDGQAIKLNDITVIGATTDKDLLPAPVLDRFKIKPYFQPYSDDELARICIQFAFRHNAQDYVTDWMAANMAMACRSTPRILDEMVLACRAMAKAMGRNPEPEEVLAFLEVEPDGLTRVHIQYLTTLLQFFARTKRDTEEIEYIAGEAAMQQILRETKPGIQRVEAFLVERGLIDRTPRGRRLRPLGIERAQEFIRAGKGAVAAA